MKIRDYSSNCKLNKFVIFNQKRTSSSLKNEPPGQIPLWKSMSGKYNDRHVNEVYFEL